MAPAVSEVLLAKNSTEYNLAEELKTFDDAKLGVKGLVDAGLTKVPKVFHWPPEELDCGEPVIGDELKVPVIDLSGGNVVGQIGAAAESWGIFQVVNHGISLEALEEALEGVRMFHEMEDEGKKEWYSRDPEKKVKYNSNVDLLHATRLTWMDTLYVTISGLHPQHLPSVCSESMMKHISECKRVAKTLYEFLSEALGLPRDRLIALECDKPNLLAAHYYPPCPEPELTCAGKKHTDPIFLNLILQDQIGGLQTFYQDKWVDVHPTTGAIIVNVGNLLQMVSNDKFKSPLHRIKATSSGRFSVVYCTGDPTSDLVYGPMEGLISDENPAIYKQVAMKDYMSYLMSKSYLNSCEVFNHYKL